MNRNSKKCLYCNKDISLSNYKRHIESCTPTKKYSINNIKKIIISDNKFKCIYCNNNIIYSKSGIIGHVWRKHGDGKLHNPNVGFNNGRIQWNQGLTSETDLRVKLNSIKIKKSLKKLYDSGKLKPKTISAEHRKKVSERQSLHNNGGKCKWYKYKKENGDIVKVQGTWELRFAKVLDKIDSAWIKPTTSNHSFKWVDDNKKYHIYTPDFYSKKLNKYFEIKGHWWGNDKQKMQKVMEQNEINIQIIQEFELKEYEKLLTNN